VTTKGTNNGQFFVIKNMFDLIKKQARARSNPTVAPVATSPRAPDVGEVVSGFEIGDWAIFAAVGSASFPIGYAIGKPIRVPSMWVMGGLGTVAGFLLAYQNSSGKFADVRMVAGGNRCVIFFKLH